MPRRDGNGPAGQGPRDGRGGGKGRNTNKKGSGRKTGGRKGKC